MRIENPLLRSIGVSTVLFGAAIGCVSSHNVAPESGPLTTHLTKQDADYFKRTINTEPKDQRESEIEWVNKVFPTVKEGLQNLYKAENSKITLSDFVLPGDFGEDMGAGANLHVLRAYEHKLPNGKTQKIYANEHWPLDLQSGKLKYPTAIRIRVQAFEGSMQQKNANDLIASDVLQIVWTKDSEKGLVPLFGRQHFYGPYNPLTQQNTVNDTEVFVDSHPYSCVGCHRNESHHIRKSSNPKLQSYGSIIQDEEYDKPIKEQVGYKSLQDFLYGMVKNGQIKTEDVEGTLANLERPGFFNIPNILAGVEQENIPWVDNDFPYDSTSRIPQSFLYTTDQQQTFVKAIYGQFQSQVADITDIDLQVK